MRHYVFAYRQVPVLNENGRCNICNSMLWNRIDNYILLYNKDKTEIRVVCVKLLHCEHCAISYATQKNISRIESKNQGFFVYKTFLCSNDSSVTAYDKIYEFPIDSDVDKICKRKYHHSGLSTRCLSIKDTCFYTIYATNINFDFCPHCGQKMQKSKTVIPISANMCVHYWGQTCGKHFFVRSSQKISNLIKNNPYISQTKIRYDYFYPDYESIVNTFKENANYHTLILLKSQTDSKNITLALGKPASDTNENIQVVDYKDPTMRRLLTEVFYLQNEYVTLSEKKYKVIQILYNDVFSSGPEDILCFIEIKNGGGYLSSIKNNNYELVGALLYSPYTQCYELASATYDKESKTYFMDISIYKNFYLKYGNPGLDIFPYYSNRASYSSKELNEESILHSFGYNVNQKDNLSDKERHNILSDIIDLKILTQKSIVFFLEQCISRAQNDKYEFARGKWRNDINFVVNYKFNPERFIIPKKRNL